MVVYIVTEEIIASGNENIVGVYDSQEAADYILGAYDSRDDVRVHVDSYKTYSLNDILIYEQ